MTPRISVRRLRTVACTLAGRAVLGRRGVSMGAAVRLVGWPSIRLHAGSVITIDARAALVSARTANPLYLDQPVHLRTLTPTAEIHIGPDVGVSGSTIASARRVEIGARTMVGRGCLIMDTNFHPLTAEARRYAALPETRAEDEVVIGADVFIGARVIVLPGARVGDRAIIGAGSVIRGTVPADSVVAGNPWVRIK
jgi:acetyltransferase-like isoleucine patch superfamily enzyme